MSKQETIELPNEGVIRTISRELPKDPAANLQRLAETVLQLRTALAEVIKRLPQPPDAPSKKT
jgi:hypothetical protein